jgi:hypothetical protein
MGVVDVFLLTYGLMPQQNYPALVVSLPPAIYMAFTIVEKVIAESSCPGSRAYGLLSLQSRAESEQQCPLNMRAGWLFLEEKSHLRGVLLGIAARIPL